MKTIVTKSVCVTEGDISVNNYPGVFAISVKQPHSQIQIDNKHLDTLITVLQKFKELRESEHTIKDVLITDTEKKS